MKKSKWIILSGFILVIDVLYPMTFTYDSGHYLSYLSILSGSKPFVDWDPVRGPVFPLFLFFINLFFGEGLNGIC